MEIRRSILLTLMVAGTTACVAAWTALKVRDTPAISTASNRWLSVVGNRIVDSTGKTWMGRGVNLHDTRSCKACAFETGGPPLAAEVKRRVDFLVDEWNVNFIRLNLESYPPDDREVAALTHYGGVLDDEGYFAEVVDIVRHIGSKPGVYVLLALWHEPSFDPQLGIPTLRTVQTWEKLAGAFVRDPHVLFGVANEPRATNAAQDEQVWQAMNTAVGAIRAVEDRVGAPRHLVAVQGTRDYGRDVSYYVDRPITSGGGVNIVYETHVYNPARDFGRLIDEPWKRIPLLIGEFGPMQRAGGPSMTSGDVEKLLDLAEQLQIPYTAWTFHMRCPPNLLEDTAPGTCGVGMELKPTAWGEFVRKRLRGASRE